MKINSIKIILFLSLLITIIGCENNDDSEITSASVSIETTNENAEKTYTTIKISGVVSSDGGGSIINRGVCWSTTANPTIEDNMITETSNEFSIVVNELFVNTTYYFRTFVTSEIETSYSEQQTINTLSLNNTSWKFTTIYPNQNDFEIYSRVDLFEDNTTKFDEMDLPGQCPGCFITYGTWSIDANNLTYIWEGSDSNNSTYVYTGILNGMSISGTYTHSTEPNGTWSAIEL